MRERELNRVLRWPRLELDGAYIISRSSNIAFVYTYNDSYKKYSSINHNYARAFWWIFY